MTTDLRSTVRGLDAASLTNYKKQLLASYNSLSSGARPIFLSKLSGIPELSDVAKTLTTSQLKQSSQLDATKQLQPMPQQTQLTKPQLSNVPTATNAPQTRNVQTTPSPIAGNVSNWMSGFTQPKTWYDAANMMLANTMPEYGQKWNSPFDPNDPWTSEDVMKGAMGAVNVVGSVATAGGLGAASVGTQLATQGAKTLAGTIGQTAAKGIPQLVKEIGVAGTASNAVSQGFPDWNPSGVEIPGGKNPIVKTLASMVGGTESPTGGTWITPKGIAEVAPYFLMPSIMSGGKIAAKGIAKSELAKSEVGGVKLPSQTTKAITPTVNPNLSPIEKATQLATEIVRQDRPGTITKLAQKVPGAKQLLEFERPGLKMTGDNEKVLVSMVAQDAAQSEVSTRLFSTRNPILTELEQSFGKGSLHGGQINVPFVGTVEQAANKKLTGTLLDAIQNPELYKLTPTQRQLIIKLQQHTDTGLNYVNTGYGTDIGRYPVKQGSAYLPNVEKVDKTIDAIANEYKNISTGRSKTRVWDTARDRMNGKTPFDPETDVQKLIEGADQFKSAAAGGNTYRSILNGKNKLQVMQETHPELASQMLGLRAKLQKLQGYKNELQSQQSEAIDSFLKSAYEPDDITRLVDELETGLKPGRFVSNSQGGKTLIDLQGEIAAVRNELKVIRPMWNSANPKPYKFVQNGIFRYFPEKQANLIRESMQTSNHPFLNFMEKYRGQAFSGDFSPFTIQGAVGVLADPWGSIKALAGGAKKSAKTGDWLRSVKVSALADDIRLDTNGWSEFAAGMGRPLSGTPREFAAGFLSKIPKFDEFTEATYISITRGSKNLYDRTWQSLVQSGMSEVQAKAAAIITAKEVYPLVSASRLGQSQARAALLRSLPTSYSFIRQPLNLVGDATKGFVKLGTLQKLTPREKLSVKFVTTIAASTLAVSATSAAINAQREGKDVQQAVWDAINPDPKNGKFASIIIGDTRIPLGGPYRSIFRAIYPSEVKGVPFPVPFAGLPNYVGNRVTPLVRTQVNLLRNKDYYNNTIVKGNFPENLLRGIEYELEGSLPLTVGSAAEGIRTGQNPSDIGQQIIGQFAGTNLIKETPGQQLKDTKDKIANKEYGQTWDEVGFTKSKWAQQELINKNPELKKTIASVEVAYSKNPTEDQKVWNSYEARQKQIEQQYQTAVINASNKMASDSDGVAFKKAVQTASSNRGAAYDLLQNDESFKAVKDYFAQPPDPKTTNPLDIARNAYYTMMYGPGTKDQYGQYDFDKAEQLEEQFIAQYGQQALDYVDKWKGISWEGTKELRDFNTVKKYLEPYWNLDEHVWDDDPDKKLLWDNTPEYQEIYDTWQKMVQTDARAARTYLLKQKQAALFVEYGQKLERLKALYKRANPLVSVALKKYYSY